ncbi:MAG: ATP-binding cassette domain-containing protein [Oscillospiraceae bacterium]|nr:ATP-binding cassette domain-containing protein [Oscillospiraceae bacterium]
MSFRNQASDSVRRTARLSEWFQTVFVSERNKSLDPGKWTGDLLFDASQFLCQKRGIPVCRYERLKRSCPEHRDFSDIARLSGFSCREVVLPDTWPSRRYEPVLAFLHETDAGGEIAEIPVVCFSGLFDRLSVFDPRTESIRPMSKEEQQKLGKMAWVVCRSFSAPQVNFRELTRFSLRELSPGHILLMLAAMYMVTQVGLAISALSETIYDKIIPMGNTLVMYEVGGLFLAALLGNLLFSLTQRLSQQGLTDRLRYALQAAVYDRLFHLEEGFAAGNESGVLAFQASNLSGTYVSVFQSMLTVVLQSSFSLFYCARMLSLSPALSRIGFAVVVLEILAVVVMSVMMRSYSSKRAGLTGRIQSFLFQMFSGIATIRTAGVEDVVLHRYMQQEAELARNDRKNSLVSLFSGQTMAAGNSVAMLLLYHQMGSNTAGLSLGIFMSFLTAYTFFASAMIQTASAGTELITMIPVLRYSSGVLQNREERSSTGTVLSKLKGDILLSNVSFAYKNQSEDAIKDISLHVQPGEYIGIVGQSGCGKSTLLRLLLGFEAPKSGVIYYDGILMRQLNLPELRRKIGTVLQDGCLFSGTIYMNISICAPDATAERVWEAVDAACLTEDIKAMPMGLQTVVSEEAQTVSGGQKQRILLARAVINHPSVLFLDEATSSLDNLVQDRIMQKLSELKATRIVVAHRLSTVQSCDRILVMDHGRIAEEGSYESLMEKKGLFWQMASRQLTGKIPE